MTEESIVWHEATIDICLDKNSTDRNGLTSDEAKKRLERFGKNNTTKEEKRSILKMLLSQFKSYIIYILIGASIISFLIGDHIEFIIINLIILFTVFLSFIEEFKATREMEALKKLTPLETRVIRAGKEETILAENLVPGDIVVLYRGGLIPADARIIEANSLNIDESALTGESIPVQKNSDVLGKETPLAERKNMVYAGGQIINGHGICVVIATGKNTELGKIASLVKETKSELSPLQKRLDKLGKQFSYAVLALCILIYIIGISRGQSISELLLLSVAVAVAGIPEGLPAVIGVTLALGMKRMAKKNAIIKRLSAVETLGTCTVICTDKTGTLTQNKMVIENIWTFNSEINVTGEGFCPEGEFIDTKQNGTKIDVTKSKHLRKIFEIGVLCNNASLKKKEEEWHIDGESTEGALIVLAKKAGIERDEFHTTNPRVHENPFDPERKCMSSVHKISANMHNTSLGSSKSSGKDKQQEQHIAYVKGAPEKILPKAKFYLENEKIKKLTKDKEELLLAKNIEYASKGFRVLCLAFKEHKSKKFGVEEVEKDLIIAGIVSIRDPPEPSALQAIKQCKEAGIKVIMITGDSPITAKAIASELGILSKEQKVITGDELDKLGDIDFSHIVDNITVYARVTPKHKLRVVKALQDSGEIVAMTGDGVNDAPALKKADIGVAMGLRGTEVAKEASEMVIKDDNFSTIVYAVKEGRTIYSNIQKFIYYLLPGNFSEVSLILTATIAGFFPPLTPIMILFINLVTSDIPAIGLCLEKPNDNIMKQKPRNPNEGILNNYVLLKIGQVVPIIVLGTIGLYMWEITIKKADIATAQSVAFATLILYELFHVFNAKSFNESVFSKSTLTNMTLYLGYTISILGMLLVLYYPPAQAIFGTVALSFKQWIPILVTASAVVFFVEIQKIIIDSEIAEYEEMNLHPTRR